MQITFVRSKTAAQYPARQTGASKNWQEFRPCRSHFFEAKRPHSTQRVREVHQKNWREFRPCRAHFFEAKRPHSIQRVREVHRKIGESSVSVNGAPAAQYAADEKLCEKNGEHSIHVHDCFANTSAIDTGSRGRGRRHGVSHQINQLNCITALQEFQASE